MKVRRLVASMLLSFSILSLLAQDVETVHYGETDGLSNSHVTQMVQDRYGFMWFATWNGLNRFDGRNFVNFKALPGDGVNMPSDRIRTVAINDQNPDLLNLRVDDNWFTFNLLTGKFSGMNSSDSTKASVKAGHGNAHSVAGSKPKRFILIDHQGLQWSTSNDGINLTLPHIKHATLLPYAQKAEVKAIYQDKDGNIWITSREDCRVRIFDKNLKLKGYLSASGDVVAQPVSFSSPIYCVFQSDKDNIWLGSKPDGLFRLTPRNGGYRVERIEQLKHDNVYDITSDRRGRLWLATMGRGVICYDRKGHINIYKCGQENRARRVYVLSDNVLMATTTEGLLTLDIKPDRPYKTFISMREANRVNSMSSSACMMVLNNFGHYFVATESGGINELLSQNPLSSRLEFRHFSTRNGLGSDVIYSLSNFGRNILAVSNSMIIILNPKTSESYTLSSRFFGSQLDFSDASPLMLSNNKWLFGLANGGLAVIDAQSLKPDGFRPPMQLTSLKIENQPIRYMLNNVKQIVLRPGERTLTLTFAALDYRAPRSINYAYRLDDNDAWNYLGNSNTVALTELRPGTYELQLRATNANGTWNPNVLNVSIKVMPRFVETAWFKLLVGLLLFGLLAVAIITRRYIQKIKRSQKETLAAYLALMEKVPAKKKSTGDNEATIGTSTLNNLSPQDKAFMDRLLKFVEEHIADSDVSNELMAQAAAVSKSGLNRKLKLIVGLTPADFLREARIKRACLLLQDTSKSVAEVAFACGFADAKYFSKVFRNSVGESPSQYRMAHYERQQ